MSIQRYPQTHTVLMERIPKITGHDVTHWLECLDRGPGLLRFLERVNWLRDAHDLPHCYAAAVVREADLRRHAIRT